MIFINVSLPFYQKHGLIILIGVIPSEYKMGFLKKNRYHIFVLVIAILALIGLRDMTKPLFIIFLLSYLFNKPVTFLEQFHIKRRISTFFLITFLLYILMMLMIVVLPIINQKLILIAHKSPFILDNLLTESEIWIKKFIHNVHNDHMEKIKLNIKEQVLSTIKYSLFYALNIFARAMSIKNIIYYFAAMPFLTYYLTVDWPYLHDFFLSLFPKKARNSTQDIVLRAGQMFSNYLHGQTLVCIILSIVYSIALHLIGFKNPIIVGTIVGFLAFIPYVGALLGLCLIAIFILADFQGLKIFVQAAIIFLSLNILESQILSPYIIGKKLGISPLVLILAIIIGNYYFGLLGMILAYPLTATLMQIWTLEKTKILDLDNKKH